MGVKVKNVLKEILSDFVYWLYRKNILKNHIRVQSVDETIEELIRTDKSLVRFGDGEMVVLRGSDIKLQKASQEIADGLKRIISYQYDGLMVSLQGIFDGVESYQEKSRKFWKEHLFFYRKVYEQYCNPDRIYANTSFSRFYYVFEDKKPCKNWIEKIKRIWRGKDIVVVEGTRTHNGVGNDLFELAGSVERIICPSSNAMRVFDKIIEACSSYSTDRLFLLSLGITAKFVAEELFLKGYRVIDIGNLDMEYEWFLHKSENKAPLPKHGIEGTEANRKAGYTKYLSQIKKKIEL